MAGRVRRKLLLERQEAAAAPETARCALCERPLGTKVEWHHPVPRSQGGRETVPLHPICHRTIHASVSNRDLARLYPNVSALREREDIARFVAWVADKPPDFHAPTRRER